MRFRINTFSLALLAACGQAPAADSSGVTEKPPVTSSASMVDTAPVTLPEMTAPAANASSARPDGIPADAIPVKNGNKSTLWAVMSENGRATIYEMSDDETMAGTSGPLSAFPDIYPDADFTPLLDAAAKETEANETGTAGTGAVTVARDQLVEVTPGAKEALERAKSADVINLTAGTLSHMIESMGGTVDFTPEELDALLQQTDGRFTATNDELKRLIREAGPDGVSQEQIAALLPLTEKAKPLGAPERGREEEGCPGLVYGNGGRKVCLPLGLLSFADKVVSFAPGEKPSKAPFDYPPSALGEPNYRSTSSADFISIGCDGVLTLQFTDNILVDVEGIDLYIFEVGPFVERTELAISQDGANWTDVGVIEGSRADVDIAPFVQKDDKFPFVRLTNASDSCGGYHSGADIDAVAAVGAEIRLSLDSALLFDVGKSDIKPEAANALAELARQLEAYGPDIRVTVEGHTDATGSDSANQTLSEARAQSVWTYLANLMGIVPTDVTIKGYGESRPVADNDTDEGRALNRRVDLLILPGKNGYLKE
ncbi:MAG: OmpA family protein [Hyphomonas sp.]